MLDTHRPGRAARSSCRRTPANSAHVRDRLHQPGAGRADRQPGPGHVHRAGRLHPPGRAERARRGPAGHHRHARRLPARRRLPDRAASSRCTARRSRSSAPGPWYTRFHTPPTRRTPTPASGPTPPPTARRSRTSPSSATTPSASTARARCSTSPTSSNIDHRQHLGRAHGLPVLGRQHRQHDHQELPDPQHLRRRHQHDQRHAPTTWSTNNEARATGDDSFALFSAIDAGGADENEQRLREPDRRR